MFKFFLLEFFTSQGPQKKIIVPHVRLSGVIGSVGRFRQGIDFSGQQEIIKKAFSFKKAKSVAISINSPGGSPVQSERGVGPLLREADGQWRPGGRWGCGDATLQHGGAPKAERRSRSLRLGGFVPVRL